MGVPSERCDQGGGPTEPDGERCRAADALRPARWGHDATSTGTTVSRPEAGRMQSTRGKSRTTGSRRAASSACRRRTWRASSGDPVERRPERSAVALGRGQSRRQRTHRLTRPAQSLERVGQRVDPSPRGPPPRSSAGAATVTRSAGDGRNGLVHGEPGRWPAGTARPDRGALRPAERRGDRRAAPTDHHGAATPMAGERDGQHGCDRQQQGADQHSDDHGRAVPGVVATRARPEPPAGPSPAAATARTTSPISRLDPVDHACTRRAHAARTVDPRRGRHAGPADLTHQDAHPRGRQPAGREDDEARHEHQPGGDHRDPSGEPRHPGGTEQVEDQTRRHAGPAERRGEQHAGRCACRSPRSTPRSPAGASTMTAADARA